MEISRIAFDPSSGCTTAERCQWKSSVTVSHSGPSRRDATRRAGWNIFFEKCFLDYFRIASQSCTLLSYFARVAFNRGCYAKASRRVDEECRPTFYEQRPSFLAIFHAIFSFPTIFFVGYVSYTRSGESQIRALARDVKHFEILLNTVLARWRDCENNRREVIDMLDEIFFFFFFHKTLCSRGN